ncbi:MBL fold metallo-hydrolase [Winogradskyella thalassocola]|uniref:Ribonuclease BN, tRNA processing enzyme n=1 Tax=Winogradskyella thalassocola TaxID=262004 RepID=A0A1G8G236_9FLAO|nr:MBL fold metallo-hydrolase [Winogradskyella thalassocola]SDH88421.1 Ribonuclease BN, tRNA processing enzyme [Winogradskyella thalassocola]
MKNHWVLVLLFLGTQLFAQKNNSPLTATIIGSGSPKYNTERSGPSVLISYKNTQILVDMGNGTQANLDKIDIKINDIDGLLFTHHHLDHNEELAPIFIQSLLGGNNTIIAGPEQTTSIIDHILSIYKEDIDYRLSKSGRTLSDVTSKYEAKNLTGNNTFQIGDITVSYTLVNHTIATLAYRFDAGDTSIVISGDLTYSESLPILAKNADYLIMDSGGAIALDSKRKGTKTNGKNKGSKENAHVNLAESSQMAKVANVKTLVLTHFNVTDIDENATTAELRKNYLGNIIYGEDLMTLPSSQNSTSSENSNRNVRNINDLEKTETTEQSDPNPQPIKKNQQESNSQDIKNTTPSFRKMLENMDTNNDGKISKSEARGKLKDNFNKRDQNKDGYITEDELTKRSR